jgi:mono/diheme cytochrome c family protein
MNGVQDRMVRFWSSWLGGIVICIVLAGIAGSAVMFGGLYDTRADNPHLRPVAWAIHQTMKSSVRAHAVAARPSASVDSALLIEGAKVYEAHCIACHGGPGIARAPWAAAMLPTPPYLVDSARHWNREELYEIIAHGVKMTGMPAWGEVLPARQVEAVTALCMAMPQLSVPQFGALRNAPRALPMTSLEAIGPAATLAPERLGRNQPLAEAVRAVIHSSIGPRWNPRPIQNGRKPL